MGEIISIDVGRQAKDRAIDEAFNAYVIAQDKAKRTLNIYDGIAAGRAWGEFMTLFVGAKS